MSYRENSNNTNKQLAASILPPVPLGWTIPRVRSVGHILWRYPGNILWRYPSICSGRNRIYTRGVPGYTIWRYPVTYASMTQTTRFHTWVPHSILEVYLPLLNLLNTLLDSLTEPTRALPQQLKLRSQISRALKRCSRS